MAVRELELDDTWAYGPGIQHGGYLLQTLAAGTVDERHPHPLAVSAHFLSAPRLGTARIEVERLRTGRSVSTSRAQLLQGDRVCVDAVVTAGLLRPAGVASHLAARPPDLPPVEHCPRSTDGAGRERNGVLAQLELRLDPAGAGWDGASARSGEARSGEARGWIRAADRSEPDPLLLLCLADALPPVTFSLGLPGWAPTVELTVHLRSLPAPGWIAAVQRAALVQDGWLDEQCELWDSAGALVAQASQLAAYRP